MMRHLLSIALLLTTCSSLYAGDAIAVNQKLGRGINLGNALDAPNEGEWGVKLEESYFKTIKDAGFNSVRIPVRWSAHAGKDAPYTIEPAFMSRVEWAVDQALKNDLAVILNLHHYKEIHDEPDHHTDRLIGLWEQIAPKFKDKTGTIVFEPLNQPDEKIDAAKWNTMLRQLTKSIRKTNPDRTLMFGPVDSNNLKELPGLDLPKDEKNIIVTVHYYKPKEFTMQGASWMEGSEAWKGTKWPASDEQTKTMQKDFATIAEWGKKHDRPMNVGEFGAFEQADMESRVKWTKSIVDLATKNQMSFNYWEFCSTFGAYDPAAKNWRDSIKNALQKKD